MNRLNLLFGSIFVVMLAGCSTLMEPVKKIVGAINIFSPSKPPPEIDEDKLLMIGQLEPFVWCSLVLIIGGVVLWKITAGSTGLGVTLALLGGGLAVFAVIMPQIAGYLGLIAILGVVVLGAYLVYKLIKRKSTNTNGGD